MESQKVIYKSYSASLEKENAIKSILLITQLYNKFKDVSSSLLSVIVRRSRKENNSEILYPLKGSLLLLYSYTMLLIFQQMVLLHSVLQLSENKFPLTSQTCCLK